MPQRNSHLPYKASRVRFFSSYRRNGSISRQHPVRRNLIGEKSRGSTLSFSATGRGGKPGGCGMGRKEAAPAAGLTPCVNGLPLQQVGTRGLMLGRVRHSHLRYDSWFEAATSRGYKTGPGKAIVTVYAHRHTNIK